MRRIIPWPAVTGARRAERRTIRRFRSDWGRRKLVDRAFLEIGIERRTVFEVSDLETLLELVARDPAIALVPEAIVEARPAHSASTRSHRQNSAVVGYAAGEGLNHCPRDFAPKIFLQLLANTRRPDSSFQPIEDPWLQKTAGYGSSRCQGRTRSRSMSNPRPAVVLTLN